MKLKQLVKRISEYADGDIAVRREKEQKLRKTPRKLEKKGVDLEEKLKAETDPIKREVIDNKLRIVAAQREKGNALLKELEDRSNGN